MDGCDYLFTKIQADLMTMQKKYNKEAQEWSDKLGFGKPSLQEELTRTLSTKIMDMKEAEVRKRLKALGMEHLLEGVKERRFKRLHIEQEPFDFAQSVERWYVDDGTDDGLLLVTFTTKFDTRSPWEKTDPGEFICHLTSE